ncbi:VWA domain-containing protein [Candidatus Uhrbacteria bacterium]|nr:VWA domain-containing protein [Candidatus Uhrbacteria bacterium]
MGTQLVHKLTHVHVTVHLGREVTHIDGGPVVVPVFVDIRPATTNPNAPPIDLRLVIDRSGSMEGRKIEAVRLALRELIGDLGPKDRLALITFADFHDLDLPSTNMDYKVHSHARALIAAIKAEGDTFISGGVEEAITRPDIRFETRLVLFTDGESTVNVHQDHQQLVKSADRARDYGLPMLVYGTGGDYNFALLQQLAVRAGNGSFLKHVMQADELLDHLRSEVGFLRGVGVRGLVVSGQISQGTSLIRAARFMPQQRPLNVGQDGAFTDASGALDRARGQQYYFEIEVGTPEPGTHPILKLSLAGTEAGSSGNSFTCDLSVDATFTWDEAAQTEPDPEVIRVAQHMAGAEMADRGDLNGASVVYERAGDHATATALRTMVDHLARGTHSRAAVDRGSETLTGGSVSVVHTMHFPQHSGTDEEKP